MLKRLFAEMTEKEKNKIKLQLKEVLSNESEISKMVIFGSFLDEILSGEIIYEKWNKNMAWF